MSFTEAIAYLFSLGNEVSAMKLGLENITQLLAALGNPHEKYLEVQVAGTNGKGSVCAFLDSICNSAGIETGVFTSPHLVSITERIKINGSDIDEEQFALFASQVRAIAEDLFAKGEIASIPTFFEQITAIALLAFAGAGVSLAILETGLGGRLDATTAANAEIGAITQIDYDHQEYLGETLAEIAAEKAAIIRAGSKVITAIQDPIAESIIRERCDLFGTKARSAADVRTACGCGWLNFATEKANYRVAKLGLLGRHQIENAKVAILIAETLQDSFAISPKNIIDGLEAARHPGRLEFQGQFLFDGAHNAAGAKALREFLDEFVPQPITLVFGVMKGKDVARMATLLFSKARTVVLTRPDNSRAMAPADFMALVPDELDPTPSVQTETVAEALSTARDLAGEDGLIVITGSLYLVGEARKILNN